MLYPTQKNLVAITHTKCYMSAGTTQKNLVLIICMCTHTQLKKLLKMITERKMSIELTSYLIMENEFFLLNIQNKTRISLPSISTTIREILPSTVRKINKHHKHQKGKHKVVFIHCYVHRSPNRFFLSD